MNYRELGRPGWRVSTVSFGAWAIGSAWGDVEDRESLAALHRAVDLGVNFFNTADVYGDGRSERLLAQLRCECTEEIIIATKAGRRLDPHVTSGYTAENLTAFVERSLKTWKYKHWTWCNCTALRRRSTTGRRSSRRLIISSDKAKSATTA